MKQADLRAARDARQIIRAALSVYAANFPSLFGIALLVAPIELLTGVLQARYTSQDAQSYISLLVFPGALVTLLAIGALTVAVHEISGGTRPEFGRAVDVAFQRFGALLSTALLAGVLVVASLAAVPALTAWWLVRRDATIDGRRNWWLVTVPFALTVYLSVRWALATQAVMIEGRERWAALDISAAAVRGRWWHTLGVLLLIIMAQLGPALLAAVARAAPPIVAGGVASAVAALVLPFVVSAQVLLYYDLKARAHADAGAHRLAAAEQDVPR